MSRIPVEVALNDSVPPLNSRYAVRAAFDRRVDDTSDRDKREKPQKAIPLYIENVLPSRQGYRSIYYPTDGRVHSLNNSNFPIDYKTKYIFCRDSLDNVTQLWISGDKAAYYNASIDDLRLITTPGVPKPGEEITYAYLKDATYIFIPGQGLFIFDIGTNSFVAKEMAGLDFDAVKGIVASGGYLLAYSSDTLYYSSIFSPLDFVPSQLTGAGSTKILYLAGAIVGALPLDNGFLIYTSGNIVSAFTTGNAAVPFGFREVEGSAGIETLRYVAANPAVAQHIVYSAIGLLSVDKNRATPIFPEVSDFLVNGLVESVSIDRPSVTWNFFAEDYEGTDKIALNYVLNKFVVISYGPADKEYYTEALVYDMTLQRWGKLKRDHVNIFPLADLGDFKVKTYLNLQTDGETWLTLQAAGTTFLDWFQPSTISYNLDNVLGVLRPVTGENHIWESVNSQVIEKTGSGFTPEKLGRIIIGYYAVKSHTTSRLYEVYLDTIDRIHPEYPDQDSLWVKAEIGGAQPEVKLIEWVESDRGYTRMLYPDMIGERFQLMIHGPAGFDLHNVKVVFGSALGRR